MALLHNSVSYLHSVFFDSFDKYGVRDKSNSKLICATKLAFPQHSLILKVIIWAYLRPVLNELIRLGEWQHPIPLKVRSLKIDGKELSCLTMSQLKFLLSYLSGVAYKVTLLCLATGARWSEAETIRAEQIQPYRVTYSRNSYNA